MQRKLLMKGKVKEAYDLGNRLEFLFTDNISVFDKVIPTQIPFKGRTSAERGLLVDRAARMGIKTHFLEHLPPAGMLCRKVDILQPESITPQSKNYSFPGVDLPLVCGRLSLRPCQGGQALGKGSGFASGHTVKLGESLPSPSWRSPQSWRRRPAAEKEEALQISGLSPQEYDQARI